MADDERHERHERDERDERDERSPEDREGPDGEARRAEESAGGTEAATTGAGGPHERVDPGDGVGAGRGKTRAMRPARVIAAAAAGIVVFGAVTGVAAWRWTDLHGGGSSADSQIGPAGGATAEQARTFTIPDGGEAFVDQTATARVADAARDITEGIFSYSYDDLDAYQDALSTYLDADMLATYQETADENVQVITQAQTTVKATVGQGDVGVQSLDGNHAVAVVIMQREGSNADDQEISDAAPLRISMVDDGDTWRAEDIQLL